MKSQTSLVVTSIAAPNKALKHLAEESKKRNIHFFVIGDVPSPSDFNIDGCDFYSMERQKNTELKLAQICPERHYARKNIGYLLAMRNGSEIIIDTDDDNLPREDFWKERVRYQEVKTIEKDGWVNIYKYFTDASIWPRGLPLNYINSPLVQYDDLLKKKLDLPIQQGLADEDPDVDAIYRLVNGQPLDFKKQNRKVAAGNGVWSPFNSQNTTWFRDAFPLLYLPAYCSFRMTDIWRSFVAQRIAWCNDWQVLFHEATVWQERNEHYLMKDFSDEVPGYLNNENIGNELAGLILKPGTENLCYNLKLCYKKLVEIGVVGEKELILLDAWEQGLNQAGF